MYKTINLSLPMLHEGQKKIVSTSKRFNVLSCGRRFGKTTMGGVLGSETAIDGHPVGWFAPDYKLLDPAFSELQMLLQPITSRVDRIMKVIHLITGGSIDFWSLKNNDSAGRGRKYKRVIIDEASYADRLKSAWEMAIRPTLFDLKGDAWFFSSPTSGHYFNVLYNKGQRSDLLWKSWRANSADNPYMSKEEMEEQARDMDERTRLQEMHGIPTDAENQYFTGASIDRQRELYQCDPQVCRYDEVNRRFRLDPSGPWCIWGDIQPAEDANYVIGIDASYGIGRSNSVISVFNAKTREQVAEYASPGVSPFDLADLAMSVGKHPFKGRFGSAYIVWEEAGGGKGMYKQFIRGDRNYPLLYSSKIEGKRNERKTRRMGWVPTHSSKKIRMGCFRAA
ncbi:MAG: hypothetical protein KDC45_04255, partial [Bacteroidetes bacterium]|nr:hypothetical protein [Bacteroidota bacterium]